ncbi:Transcription factor [Penicillium sp. IBT 31633x]|nr:Transcription factor [Penicillium sp. IBT 31633x]
MKIRKKFAIPPVKVACLACRASKTRCSGQEPCSSCVSKRRECCYLASKRGGPRKKNQISSPSPEKSQKRTRYSMAPDITEGTSSTTECISCAGGPTTSDFSQVDFVAMPVAGLAQSHTTVSTGFPSIIDDADAYFNHFQSPKLLPAIEWSPLTPGGSASEMYVSFLHHTPDCKL